MKITVSYYYNDEGELTWSITGDMDTLDGDTVEKLAAGIKLMDSKLKGEHVN